MNKKLIIIAGLVVLLLGGGAGGGMFAMGMFDSSEATADGEEEVVAAGEEDEAGEEHSKEGEEDGETVVVDPGVSYVEMKPISAPVFENRRIAFNVMLTFSLELTDSTHRAEVARMMPRLRDAMVRDLYAKGVSRNDGSGRFDFIGIKRRMLRITASTVQDDMVNDVLVISAIRIN